MTAEKVSRERFEPEKDEVSTQIWVLCEEERSDLQG
jgi:hypothetical protein